MTTLDLSRDYFSLFHLEPVFNIDTALLAQRYRDVQAEIHPDRFASKSEHEQRLAVQYAAFVNEAYQCLKNPLERARYLMRLKGYTTAHTVMDNAFLIEQMDLREALEQARHRKDRAAVEAAFSRVSERIRQQEGEFIRAFAAGLYPQALQAVVKWQFLIKLREHAEWLDEKS